MTRGELAELLLECEREFEMCESHWGSDYTDIRTRLKAAAAETAEDSDEPVTYDIEDAIRIAGLWRVGKMIGGDQDGVRDALLAEVERVRGAAVEPDAFSSVPIDQCPDQHAWIGEKMEFWHREGMRYVRVTEDTARNTLWAEFWKGPPYKEAPFRGHYTADLPVRTTGDA